MKSIKKINEKMMTLNRSWVTAFIFVVFAFMPLFIHAQEINLMPSGDPEKEGWKIFGKDSPEMPFNVEWNERGGRHDDGCFHMSAGNVGVKTIGWRSKKIDVPPGVKALAFSVWVRGKGVSNAWIIVNGASSDPKRSSLYSGTFDDQPLKGDFDWTRIEAVIPVRPDIKQVSVGLCQNDSGETWFDGLTMRPAEPPAVGPEVGPGIVEVKGSFKVKAEKNITNVPILFPVLLANDGQVPLTFKLWTTPEAALVKSRVYEDKPGNWVCEAFIAEVEPEGPVAVEWNSMVLCAPAKPVALPGKAAFPKRWPKAVLPWLKSTYSVESDDPRFKVIAKEIRLTNSDIIGVMKEAYHRSGSIGRGTFGAADSQRSTVVLEKSSVCTGDANRLAAILRACGIPARILSGYFNDAVPLQTHYWVQAYLPGSGWIQAMEPAYPGKSHEFSNIYVSVVYPEYEDLAKGRFPNAADGVPYLSLNESPRCDGTFSFIGGMSSGFCDHSATQWLSYISETSNTSWDKVMKNVRKNWIKWLKSRKTFQSGILETPLKQEQLKDISFDGLNLILENAGKSPKRKDNGGK
jgi:hypothetical protein